ncbi:CgeB family protein [Rhodospirillum rubrum]|uniref:Spore protein YkvP/CgeB glycosyl transferase-like domain-containing protein n=1 Tax=Rhodospirillum rubrum (strain ATCC 11170 / ATH 1.1.1 / DSM 467 / LMG 4362 / NCIMB 8255 / S1) TaxID=269796 RepID=Q2RVV8_RHORT|nr:glycosyltransferase [Rhodospirillum rubrum]ABC21737.1 conserved hypothetical protein [Rhodospirillum rubrum ATCC 11170]AEO47435.1 hypothetical protein F11_04825 [Rhodospirillum rubrum F11]MBK5953293.1 hypothetical protein [Rhodospirillum rubrum]QXG81399.1 glycosyltransferase [Rhodospirillum rubrum]HAQ00544.1 hypothetical protein [Rhodospirillum rubrum]
MRFLIVDTVYPGFLSWLYNERSPGLAAKSFAEQVEGQDQGFFHTAGAWRPALEALGHEVMVVSANNAPQQLRWMVENDLLDKAKMLSDGLVFGTYILRQNQEVNWQTAIVREQVKKFRPHVLLCANLYMFDDDFLTSVEGSYGKAIGQHAAVMPRNSLKKFDAIISSLPHQVQLFRDQGIRAEMIGLAFDERLLPHLAQGGPQHEVAFVGSVSPSHSGRAHFLRDVAREIPLDFWGEMQWPEGIETAGLRIRANPAVYGLPMYQILHDSQIVLNFHLDAAGDYANNLRLFEVTGVGALLMTDDKKNIGDYFEPDRDCVVFKDAEDCVKKLIALKENPDKRRAIAAAGQERTLKDHSYRNRVGPLLDLIS